MTRYLLAIDAYKGCLSSHDVEEAVGEAVARSHGTEVAAVPVSDGGDGMLPAFINAYAATKVEVVVHDALMRRVKAAYGIDPDGTAIIDTSQAIGLALLKPKELRPLVATTYGVGELIADAHNHGCRNYIIGLGGSATSDCGKGFLKALVDKFQPNGIIDDVVSNALSQCSFTLASDVENPLCGERGAARMYAQQKGASPHDIEVLEKRACEFAVYSERHCGMSRADEAGAGAAGGLGFAFMQYLGAEVVSGAELLFEKLNFSTLVEKADIVITGEGRSDESTLMGKLPARVLSVAQNKGVPVWLLSGSVSDCDMFRAKGFSEVIEVTPPQMPLTEAMKPDVARSNIVKAMRRILE